MQILIVDDEPAVLRAEARWLEATGHGCKGASTSSEALDLLETHAFDVAILDVNLGGDNGIELARTLRTRFPRVPVIMVTGHADFTTVNEARAAGAVDFLTKPVNSRELSDAVERAGTRRPHLAGETRRKPAPRVLSVAGPREGAPRIDTLFHAMVRAKASDLHLSAGAPPLVRLDGEMRPLDAGAEPLSADEVIDFITPIIPGKNRREFERRHDTDFAYEIEGLARFRANVFRDRKGMGAVFRTVPTDIMTAEQLGLSDQILELCRLRKGLVLVTGPTGSGKSTTLAALVDYVNRTRHDHIVTIEDPIEFVHPNKQCLVNQREVHSHTRSFKAALRAALREDPDVILIGEMRDLETVAIALETAETGHLVFGTLHTTTAASTVDRIIDQFPSGRQEQIRVMLAESLRAVIAQTLCRRTDGGRVAALEVLLVNTAISNLIREGKTFQIPTMMQVGRSSGMVTLNDALAALVRAGTISADEAVGHAVDKSALATILGKA